MDRDKANEAANELSGVPGMLGDAGLHTLSDLAQGLLDRLEAVLEGDTPYPGDTE